MDYSICLKAFHAVTVLPASHVLLLRLEFQLDVIQRTSVSMHIVCGLTLRRVCMHMRRNMPRIMCILCLWNTSVHLQLLSLFVSADGCNVHHDFFACAKDSDVFNFPYLHGRILLAHTGCCKITPMIFVTVFNSLQYIDRLLP